MESVAVEIFGSRYEAVLVHEDEDTQEITIDVHVDGEWAGRGRWNHVGESIADCPADLPEEAYDLLDAAIKAALSA